MTKCPVKKRILYVEDDLGPRESLRLLLTEAGYELETAEDGEDGLSKIEETLIPFDLIITGIAMPVMSGDVMVSIIRRKGLTIPILVISGGRYERGCELVREKLVSACMPKPFKLDDLLDMMKLLFSDSLGTC